MLAKLLTAAAVATLAAAPVMASPAATLSRASTTSENESEIAGAVVIGVLATAALVGGAIVLADNDDEADSN